MEYFNLFNRFMIYNNFGKLGNISGTFKYDYEKKKEWASQIDNLLLSYLYPFFHQKNTVWVGTTSKKRKISK